VLTMLTAAVNKKSDKIVQNGFQCHTQGFSLSLYFK